MGIPPKSEFALSKLFIKAQGLVFGSIFGVWLAYMMVEHPDFYEPGCNFQGFDWSKQTSFMKQNFAYLRSYWMAQMGDDGQTNVAIALDTKNGASG